MGCVLDVKRVRPKTGFVNMTINQEGEDLVKNVSANSKTSPRHRRRKMTKPKPSHERKTRRGLGQKIDDSRKRKRRLRLQVFVKIRWQLVLSHWSLRTSLRRLATITPRHLTPCHLRCHHPTHLLMPVHRSCLPLVSLI